ncbi:type I polyketide synthase [Amycolatopsis aidingensis]|uniref:type I polyketide synthase n=1 Tax=Amycolatopsis aidingensis TaxID=2842453 RepID=UPI001C0C965C|nr:type I polyketide synthase [Amycolatopsis aidingensis]
MNSEAEWRAWLLERLAAGSSGQVTERDVDRPLRDLGVSSRNAVAIAAQAGELLGRELPATLVWTAPTIGELAKALAAGPQSLDAGGFDPSVPDAHEGPVAVVGLGCRFPGAATPAGFWRLLTGGRDGIGEVPAGRWERFVPDVTDHDLPRQGGFLDDVAGFDAEFFGISPDEAEVMDPQQRLLLEVTWEALAHAGIPAASLRGTDCGVFVGLSAAEYAQLTMTDLDRVDAWSATGAAASVTANRVSYALGAHGPSMTVDTACSSSLVAVNLAARALADGDASTAVVGGVNLLLSPAITANFQRAGLLAADGRCKPFDAAADGIVRGEGCGVVVLKRLEDARRDGDRILALIKGGTVNSDGRSNGLIAPNPAAQQRLLSRAYQRAGVRTPAVDYVEAHGTGTSLGDPIEAGALASVLGAGRPARRPLLIGSVKSNLGHLEGAAGIAGLIKVVLSLWHSRIPPSLNFTAPSPHIDFAGARLEVVTENTEWPRYPGIARAGVSSFGFGGTNAHVVLEEWQPTGGTRPRGPVSPGRAEVVALSGRSPARLRARARALADWLDGPEDAHPDIAVLAAALAHAEEDGAQAGAAVPARNTGQLCERLRALAEGQPHRSVFTATPAGTDSGPVFVFSGYGSQWPGMARRLLAEEPAFAEAVTELDGVFREVAGVELSLLLAEDAAAGPLSSQQFALFGMQVALARLWRAYGVRPAAVIGHSMGEVAAAVAVGALEPAEGLRVMVHRTAVLDELQAEGAGAMAVVELAPGELDELADDFPGITVAVYASPAQCTVSGPAEQVRALVARVEAGGGLARTVPTGVAGHSAAVEPLLDRFTTALTGLRPTPEAIPPGTTCYSSVLADPRTRPAFDAGYWAANLRRPVRFTQAIGAALAEGHRLFVEISPHPVTLVAVEQTAKGCGAGDLTLIPTLHRDPEDADDGFAAALAALYPHGRPEVLRARYPDREVIDLPPPVWEHREYWADPVPSPGRTGHPFLGEPVEVPGTDRRVWPAEVGLAAHPWLAAHTAHEVPILPGAAFVELMLAAAADSLPGAESHELREVVLHRPLPLAEHTEVSVSATPVRAGEVELSVSARRGGEWECYAAATATTGGTPTGPVAGAVLAEVTHPGDAKRSGFTLHPDLGEACVRAPAALAGDPDDRRWLRVTRIGRVRVTGDPRRAATVSGSLDASTPSTGSARLLDAEGAVLAEWDGITLTGVARADVPFLPERLAYQASWVPSELPTGTGSSPTVDWIVLHGDGVRAGPLVDRLIEEGHRALAVPLARRAELGAIAGDPAALGGVVVLPDVPGSPGELDTARALPLAVAEVVRELTGLGEASPRLWLVTSGAAAVRAGEAGHPGLAALRGLVRVLAYEHPELRATTLDVGEAEDAAAVAVPELLADPPEDEVAWRDGRRFAYTLTRAELPAEPRQAPVVRDGAYLITGGLGGLGIAAARWLAGAGATRIVLSARRGPSTAARTAIEEITAAGVRVEVVTGDIAEPGVAERMVRAAGHGDTPVRGVLHAAGVLADGAVFALDADAMATAWRAKTEGALRLHEACAGIELDWWLAYSSAAALFGSPGQAAYATANAWLDAFTAWRRAKGLPAATVQWGAWAEIGGAAGKDNPVLEPMPPREGIAALSAVLASGRGQTAITRLDTEAVLELFPRLAQRPFFAELVAPGQAAVTEPGAGIDAIRALAAGDPDRARAAVCDHIVSLLAEMMWLDTEALDPHAPLTSLGLDSLLAMRARGAVERDFGATLPLPLLLRGASLVDLADHLVNTLRPEGTAVSTSQRPAARPAGGGPGGRDFAERWVGRILRQVLGPESAGEDVEVHLPLAEAGLDDAAAERLREAVSAALGRAVTTEELLAVPTIAGMADAVRAELESTGDGPMRLLGSGGDGDDAPLYLFHAAGSPTAVYRPLVGLLEADVTCYGMERLDHLDTVEAKAARYAELIRGRQPDGPYRLGGWSFGGLLAFEVARQLTAAGAEVELLFLIDTIIPLPDMESSPEEALRARLRRFVSYIEQTYQVDLGLPEGELVALPEEERNELVMRRLSDRVAEMGAAVLEHQRTSYVDARISEQHVPGAYSGPVLLFRAKDPHPLTTTLDPRYLRTDDALGWDEFCQDLEVVKVPGDHITVIDPPHVAIVADRISAELSLLRK